MATTIIPVIRVEPSSRTLDQLAERTTVTSPNLTAAVTSRASTPPDSSEMRREQGGNHARSDRAREAEHQRKALAQNAIAAIKGEDRKNKQYGTSTDGKSGERKADGTLKGEEAVSGLASTDVELLMQEPPRLPTPPDPRPVLLRDGIFERMTIQDIQALSIPHLMTPSTTALKGYEAASRDFLVASLNVKS